MARLLSVDVGFTLDIFWEAKIAHKAVWKSAFKGRRMMRRLNIDSSVYNSRLDVQRRMLYER